MKHKFKLPIGDWSNDGHGQCDRFLVESSISPEELIDPWTEALTEAGLDEICGHCGDNYIPIEFFETLELDPEKYVDASYIEEDDFGDTRVIMHSPEAFAQLVLDVVQLKFPDIELKIVPDVHIEFNNHFAQKVKKRPRKTVLPPLGYGLYPF